MYDPKISALVSRRLSSHSQSFVRDWGLMTVTLSNYYSEHNVYIVEILVTAGYAGVRSLVLNIMTLH